MNEISALNPNNYGKFGDDHLKVLVEPGDILEGLLRTYDLNNGIVVGEYLVRKLRMKVLKKDSVYPNKLQVYVCNQLVVLNVYVNGSEQCLKVDSPSIIDNNKLSINERNQQFYINDFAPLTRFEDALEQ